MYDIEINDLSVYYGTLCAIENINLKIKNKEFIGIIGPNGGGKTTLIKVLLGLIKPFTGKVLFNREVKMGYVPQFTNFDKTFPIDVLDVILMGRLTSKFRLFHKYSEEDIKQAEYIMVKLNILDLKRRQIGKLSGGQLQKVLIARALISKPNILILDEPTANLDTKTRKEIYSLLKKLNTEMTIIIVSHDMEYIFSYIDSVACLNKTLHYHRNQAGVMNEVLENVYDCPVKIFVENERKHNDLTGQG